MKVKICGITNLEDALVASAAGADYLGFIFYPPSKRGIDLVVAQKIVDQLRQRDDCPTLVGVFVNEKVDRMVETLAFCNLDLAQLSGEEVPYIVADARSPLFGRSYKALRPISLEVAKVEAEWYTAPEQSISHPALLIDTYHPTLRGGTGETGNWELSAQLVKSIPRLMLAGGLNVENISTAVKTVRPFAVDVASGVEAKPGEKDSIAVREFIHLAKIS
jgi:phosphoribosylanthranilate isomerase